MNQQQHWQGAPNYGAANGGYFYGQPGHGYAQAVQPLPQMPQQHPQPPMPPMNPLAQNAAQAASALGSWHPQQPPVGYPQAAGWAAANWQAAQMAQMAHPYNQQRMAYDPRFAGSSAAQEEQQQQQ